MPQRCSRISPTYRKPGWHCASRRKSRRLMTDVSEKFGLAGRNLLDQATLKAESTRIFNRTFAVTTALNAFTLGVAGVALLTSLLTLANSRLPQLAPLWAIGVTRRRLAPDRAHQDHVGRIHHGAAGAAARPARRLVPDRHRQCESIRVAAAVRRVPATALEAARRCKWPRRCWPRCYQSLRLARMQPANLVKVFASER